MHSYPLLLSVAICVTLLSSVLPSASIPSALAHPQEYIQASFDGAGIFANEPDPQPFEAGDGQDVAANNNDDSAAQGNNAQATATQNRGNGPQQTRAPGKKGEPGKKSGKKGKQPDCSPTRASGKKGGGMRQTQPATTGVFDGNRGKKAPKTMTAIPSPTAGAGKKGGNGQVRGNDAETPQATEAPAAAPKVEEQSAPPAPAPPADAGQQKQAAKSSATSGQVGDGRIVLAALVGGMAVLG
ncbi:hypothetical protein BCR44DRAFT_1442148, partial [Catenaria anguillulae PL171]